MHRFVESGYKPTPQDFLYTESPILGKPYRNLFRSAVSPILPSEGVDFSLILPADLFAIICSFLSLHAIQRLELVNKKLKSSIKIAILFYLFL